MGSHWLVLLCECIAIALKIFSPSQPAGLIGTYQLTQY